MEIKHDHHAHSGNYSPGGNSCQYIVVHNTGGPSGAYNEAEYAQNNQHPNSYHYVLDGTDCYQILDDTDTAWAVGAWAGARQLIRNNQSISIEVCSDGTEFTGAEKEQLRELVGILMERHGIDADHVVRHYDCHTGHKLCPQYYSLNPDAWEELKAYITTEGEEVSPEEITAAVAAGINMQEYVQRCGSSAPIAQVRNDGGEVYRLYNEGSGDHIFTTKDEADALAKSGWEMEGIAWTAPAGGTKPVYRLYNAGSGDHMLTANYAEANELYKAGWSYEGVPFFASGEGQAVHRLYNPNGGDHMLTASEAERDSLEAAGWTYEGVAFNA
ncbi:N-acetylmuramoyl-L-alanine amidase [Denitrobacterium detoxificans]|uniref:N-acetylmuramoyl-L-alanine amidase n=1 Tax=Denitrobacterium detoxificans TaxID=79604 RepID=A0A1H8UCN4_9ACTN|nr:N-acetylmuramoyl-L-alanine amidase [Denitrobacterium detoxificans]SEP00955.1 N-acetylmuramoyl-L-alanine amidase [Denitrobacterium detoxificans]